MNHFLKSFSHYEIPDLPGEVKSVGEVVLLHTRLAPDEELFVDKMIQAFNWEGVNSTHQIFDSKSAINFQLIWSQKQIRLVLIFGISPHDIGLNIQIKPYQLNFLDPFHIYLADPVTQLANHKENKARIWKDLRYLSIIPESGK